MSSRRNSESSPDSNVTAFVDAVLRQWAAPDARSGNREARRYIRAWERLRDLGPSGIDAVLALLEHQEPRVRLMAAVFLSDYHRDRCMEVLESLLDEPDALFGAQCTINRLKQGKRGFE